jgi:hypothetical protein
MNPQRRNFLRALGLLGPAYFLPSLGGGRRAQAASAIPTRIIFFYTPHGTLFRQWMKAPAGATTSTENNFDFGPILQPFASLKSKLTLVEGLGMASTGVDPTPGQNGHVSGQTHALSAINRASSSTAGGISIDQFIAKGINTPVPVTALPSLELSARTDSGVGPFTTSWSGPGALVPAMTNPSAVYARLFPNGPPTMQTQGAAAALAQRRKSILDGVLAEFNAVKQPLSSVDKNKLDAHASLIRNLELRNGLGATAGACFAPDQGTVTGPYSQDCPTGKGNSCIQDAATAFTSLAVSALACDITRVITFDLDQLPSTLFGVDDIHAFLHGMDDLFWLLQGDASLSLASNKNATDPGNIAIANKFYVSYATILANLLLQLDAVPEPDGSTLLDHTIVVWCGELGTPNHTNYMMNYLLAGSGGGFLKTGRYLQFQQQKNGYGPAHNNLFVSLANAMGLSNVTTFGNPSVCTGPLQGLQG